MLDLSYGDPVFLESFWKNLYLDVKSCSDKMKYQYDVLPELKKAIINIHRTEKNAITNKRHIVVGNGATQLILATMVALNRPVYAMAPYFFRFPTMAKMAGVKWGDNTPYFSTQIITTPNNPDNYVTKDQKIHWLHKTIFDLSYNWKQYTDPVMYDEEIMIFSLAKASGHASTRIGWGLFKDEKIAEKVRDYIEVNTMGVSVEAQTKASLILNKDKNVFDFGRKILDNRWDRIRKLKVPFEILNNSGMFLWCKGECPDGLRSIGGSNFGYSDSYFRLSIGCSDQDFNTFCSFFEERK